MLASRDEGERLIGPLVLDLFEDRPARPLAETPGENVRDDASRYEPLGEQFAVLLPLAEHETPTSLGERGYDVVADERGAVGEIAKPQARLRS